MMRPRRLGSRQIERANHETAEEAERFLREQGVDVEAFLERVRARCRATFASMTDSERRILRARFAGDPNTLALLDEVEAKR